MSYKQEKIHDIVIEQRKYFRSGETLDIGWRIEQLKKLKSAVIANQTMLQEALAEDLGRSPVEAFLCDVGPVIVEVNEILKGLRKWARPEHHFSGLMCFPSTRTTVYKMPYGVSLIISPFNFPVLLTLGVLAASLSGGNTAVIKTSSKSASSTKALKKLISETFPEKYVAVIDGGHDIADMCLAERFDKIFYTGSPAVAKHVLEMASHNLTSVALELGGETGNWAVVRKDANLRDAARKIAFFKLCNAGQICININQIAVAEEVAEPFLKELKAEFVRQIGERPELNPEYPKLIASSVFDKCERLSSQYKDRIVFGGTGDRESRKFSPTIIYPVGSDEEIVKHELFCPLLPVVPFKDSEIDSIMDLIADREHPLALYVFTSDMKWAKKVMTSQQYGGGCINDTVMHVAVPGMPFGGVGDSGMGCYHGKQSFDTFTHVRSIVKKANFPDLPMRYFPYTDKKLSLIKRFLK